jgi:hypothetical protein
MSKIDIFDNITRKHIVKNTSLLRFYKGLANYNNLSQFYNSSADGINFNTFGSSAYSGKGFTLKLNQPLGNYTVKIYLKEFYQKLQNDVTLMCRTFQTSKEVSKKYFKLLFFETDNYLKKIDNCLFASFYNDSNSGGQELDTAFNFASVIVDGVVYSLDTIEAYFFENLRLISQNSTFNNNPPIATLDIKTLFESSKPKNIQLAINLKTFYDSAFLFIVTN